MTRILNLALCLLFSFTLSAQDMVLPLWPEGIPCANEHEIEIKERPIDGRIISKVHEPDISVFLPSKASATGTGVVICPGGGYSILAWDKEGTRLAEWFNSKGVAAFVLKYRLPRWESEACRSKVALMDAQRAIRLVRSKAQHWHLSPDRIGIMGFSAGGHLASTAATHFENANPEASNPLDRLSSRPDFAILMYPVVSLKDPNAHKGSRKNLIGASPDEKMVDHFSNELQVTAQTPPTLLIHANNDKGVVPENSVDFYLALRKHGVPAALHIYESGGHGFGLAKGFGDVDHWPKVCADWMEGRGLLGTRSKVLIVEGQNNHKNWPETTVMMKGYLEETGLFSVDVVRSPAKGEPMENFRPDFSSYDVVLSNYNGDDWPEETQKDFESFVYSGGGLVIVHAANNAFSKWEEFNKMIGLGGWEQRTEKDGPYVYFSEEGEIVRDESPGKGGHHGEQHEFVIQSRQPDHPIMKGLPEKWLHTKDELYDMMRGPAVNMNILASAYSPEDRRGTGRHEPLIMTLHYGMGRVFHTMLGHGNYSQECVGFITTLQRGSEWAATGKVTQEVPEDFPTEEKTSSRTLEK